MRKTILTGFYLCAISIAGAQMAVPASFERAQSVDSHEISAIALTIYPDNLGLVRETRTIDLPAGLVDIRLFGVSDMIIPQSAILENFEGLRLEGNFDSDLITPAKLIERSIGSTLTIRRINPATGEVDLVDAELVSAAPNAYGSMGAVFSTADGVEGYQCSGLSEALILSKLPDNLHSIPVLSTRVSTQTAGPREITLTYMTRGLGWSADYRMDVESGKDEVGLLGWLTLTNETSKSFKEAELSVVAGSLNQVKVQAQPHNSPPWSRVVNCAVGKVATVFNGVSSSVVQEATSYFSGGGGGGGDEIIVTASKRADVREAKQEDLGDYKLYRAPQAVSVEPLQTKQIAFLSKHNVALKQGNGYRWTLSDVRDQDGTEAPIKGSLIYELDNSQDGNLAVPLPSGTVRAMSQTEDGLNVFMGEDRIENTPVGLPIELEIADSFLVTAQFTELEQNGDHYEMQVEVKNATDEKIRAEIDFDILEDIKIRRGSKRKSLPKDDKVYSFNVPAEKTLTFTFQARYLEH